MIEDPKIKSLVTSFTDLLADLQRYYQRQGRTAYTQDRFKWLRPERVESIRDTEQISEPYSLDELRKQGAEYIGLQGPSPTRKDYAVLDLETSLLHSFARAFNERHTSKIRHFSHSAGVSAILAKEGTGMIDQIHTHASSLLAAQ